MAPTQQDNKQDTATGEQKPIGVAVDDDATRKHPAVTVLVTPGGLEIDADTWSDANNLLSAGARVKDGYPTGPLQTVRGDDEDGDATDDTSASAKPEEVSRVPERPVPSSGRGASAAQPSPSPAPAAGGASATSTS